MPKYFRKFETVWGILKNNNKQQQRFQFLLCYIYKLSNSYFVVFVYFVKFVYLIELMSYLTSGHLGNLSGAESLSSASRASHSGEAT